MKKCAFCKNSVLFGGKSEGSLTYCNARCQARGTLLAKSNSLPPQMVATAVQALHSGLCPKCHGAGPIDVHSSYRVWSAVFLTSWSTRRHLCCSACAQRAKILDVLFCGVLGWWGIPWGLLVTPIQIGRNLVALARPLDMSKPSPDLERVARLQLVQQQSAARLPLAA